MTDNTTDRTAETFIIISQSERGQREMTPDSAPPQRHMEKKKFSERATRLQITNNNSSILQKAHSPSVNVRDATISAAVSYSLPANGKKASLNCSVNNWQKHRRHGAFRPSRR